MIEIASLIFGLIGALAGIWALADPKSGLSNYLSRLLSKGKLGRSIFYEYINTENRSFNYWSNFLITLFMSGLVLTFCFYFVGNFFVRYVPLYADNKYFQKHIFDFQPYIHLGIALKAGHLETVGNWKKIVAAFSHGNFDTVNANGLAYKYYFTVLIFFPINILILYPNNFWPRLVYNLLSFFKILLTCLGIYVAFVMVLTILEFYKIFLIPVFVILAYSFFVLLPFIALMANPIDVKRDLDFENTILDEDAS